MQTLIAGASAFVGAIAGVASLAWWLRGLFVTVNTKIDATKELLATKIDDHEKMDIERFGKQELAIMRLEMKSQNEGKPLYGI